MFCDSVSGPGPDFSSLLCGLCAGVPGFTGALVEDRAQWHELLISSWALCCVCVPQDEPSVNVVRLIVSVCRPLWVTDVISHALYSRSNPSAVTDSHVWMNGDSYLPPVIVYFKIYAWKSVKLGILYIFVYKYVIISNMNEKIKWTCSPAGRLFY